MSNAIPLKIKRDHMKPVLSVECVSQSDGVKSRTDFFILYPGDNFERFGGSSRGLTVQKTPSLITRYSSLGHVQDVEYNLENADVWSLIGTLINGIDGYKVTATPHNME